MLIPPAATIRMEQRWELQPFIAILLVLTTASCIANLVAPTGRIMVMVSVTAGAWISHDLLMSNYFGRIYLLSSSRIAGMVFRDIVTLESGETTPVAFLLPQEYCSWVLREGAFFKIYGGITRPVQCLPSSSATKLPPKTKLYADRGGKLVVVPAD